MKTTCRDCGAWTPGTERCIACDPESFPVQEPEESSDKPWTTADEMKFIRRLAAGSPEAVKSFHPDAWPQYARIVLEGMREYPATVNVARLRAEVRRLIGG